MSHEEQEPLHLDPETCYVSMVTLCRSCRDQGLASEHKAASCASLKSWQDLNFMFTWSFSLLVWHWHALDDQIDNWFLRASQSRWLQTSQATSETVSRAIMRTFLDREGKCRLSWMLNRNLRWKHNLAGKHRKCVWKNNILTHLAPDRPSLPALLPYRETRDHPVAAG